MPNQRLIWDWITDNLIAELIFGVILIPLIWQVFKLFQDYFRAKKIDRLPRSPKDFYQLIEVFEKHDISFISITERFDTSTPTGRLLRNIMLTFAQFERELVSERTKEKK